MKVPQKTSISQHFPEDACYILELNNCREKHPGLESKINNNNNNNYWRSLQFLILL